MANYCRGDFQMGFLTKKSKAEDLGSIVAQRALELKRKKEQQVTVKLNSIKENIVDSIKQGYLETSFLTLSSIAVIRENEINLKRWAAEHNLGLVFEYYPDRVCVDFRKLK